MPIPSPANSSPLRRTRSFLACALGAFGLAGLLPGANGETLRIAFTNLTTRQGLADGPLVEIRQDQQGRIVFAQRAGLACFDGFALRPIFDIREIESKVPHRSIRAFAAAADGSGYWIGTESGLVFYDPEARTHRVFCRDPDAPSSLCHDTVTALLPEGRDRLWVGTASGLFWFHTGSGTFHRVDTEPLSWEVIRCLEFTPSKDGPLWAGTRGSGLFQRLPDGTWKAVWGHRAEISSIRPGTDAKSGEKILWVGTMGEGLFRCDQSGLPKRQYLPGNGNGMPARDILSLCEDSHNTLWVGTPKGVSRFDTASETWCNYRHEHDSEHSVARGAISAIHEDRRGVLWIGSDSGEVSRYRLNQYWFPHFSAGDDTASSLSNNSVMGMCESAEGRVWIGTENGLNRFDPRAGVFESWIHRPGDVGSLPDACICCVKEDRRGRLWLGTRGGGLARLDGCLEPFKRFNHDPSNPGSLPGASVSAIYEDRQGLIWVGVPGTGLVWFDEKTEGFHPLSSNGADDIPRFVNQLFEDAEGRVWAACTNGLWLLDPGGKKLIHYRHLPTARDSLPVEHVLALAGGRDGALWIGTSGGGVTRFQCDTGAMTNFSEALAGGMADDICGLAEDGGGKVWISSRGGLSLLTPNAGSFRHFNDQDGVQASQFHPGSFLRLRDGTLLFGGPDGLDQIDPNRLPEYRKPARPLLTGLDYDGQPVLPSANGILPRPLPAMMDQPLRLPYNQKMRFALHFGTLDYSTLEQYRFEYRLEGFEDTWQKAKADHVASYRRPPPGLYCFNVRASIDGIHWEELAHPLRLVIDPPCWRSLWAILTFILTGVALITGISYGFFHVRNTRERAHRQRLEFERNRAEAALSRQVQDAMLLERTRAEFQRSLDSAQVFEIALRGLGEHFKIQRCFLAAVRDEKDGMDILAQFAAPGLFPLPFRELSTNHPIVARISTSEKSVDLGNLEFPNLDLEPCHSPFTADEEHCICGIRTAYKEQFNGIIVLQRDRAAAPWTREDLSLLESLAGQLGIGVAQFLLSQKEARQARELQGARVAADTANKAKSDFLAKMTHELRTPLNAIIGFSEILKREPGLRTAHRKHLDIISASGDHLLGVINDILEVSKIEEGKAELNLERFDLKELLDSVHGMMSVGAEKKGIALELLLEGDLPREVNADKQKVRQIIINLLSNAIKFTSKGAVSLSVKVSPDSKWAGTNATEEGHPILIAVTVCDTGEGIAEEELPKLFGKFVQTQSGKKTSQGTGLGLTIVKGFTQLMGGTVEVQSRLGAGTTFSLEIPVLAIRREHRTLEGGTQQGEIVGLAMGHPEIRVLVVEDQEMNRLLMHKLLTKAGFVIGEAENGKIAVEKWQEFNPSIIFMDENMPVMCGLDATREIVSMAGDRTPPIVALTAFALEDQRRAALEAGCVDFLAKPFKREDLFEMIRKHCKVTYRYKGVLKKAA